MTKKELRQIYYLNKEIEMWTRELEAITCQSMIKGQEITGMPFRSDGISDKVGNMASTMTDISRIINGKLTEIQIQRKKIIDYINTIDDSLVRQIIFYRHVSCMSWIQIASYVGGDNKADGVRMIHNRFLEKM